MIGTTVLTGSNQVATEEDIVKPKAAVQKLSYNEKREFETLEKDMPLLEKEKQDLEINMSKEGINFDQIQLAAKRVADIIALLEEKELRWLELSERL
jgi:ATP-binding cassette subfamily F protein uup